MRKTFDAKTKFMVVVELLKWRKTTAQITAEYGVHATQQANWKQEFMKWGAKIFSGDKRKKENRDEQRKIEQLERKVGQYAIEVDWLQKKIDEFC